MDRAQKNHPVSRWLTHEPRPAGQFTAPSRRSILQITFCVPNFSNGFITSLLIGTLPIPAKQALCNLECGGSTFEEVSFYFYFRWIDLLVEVAGDYFVFTIKVKLSGGTVTAATDPVVAQPDMLHALGGHQRFGLTICTDTLLTEFLALVFPCTSAFL